MVQTPRSILALDVGEVRVGVAVASLVARLPRPLTTLNRNDNFWNELQLIIESEAVGELVVGLPRNLSGQSTAQTTAVEAFANELKRHFGLPVNFQDEAVTSKKAEAELESRKKPYSKGDIDALAATYILEDYLEV
ncbi:MAG TPA: Holliday junction resolvase RuvX [Candidatus Saccharimonadales bacterium]|jgi:putative Holliday junction resolvase|nr:Holliday junction resolvase RuvX [Candidatus Saccharimonadales bacterium]